MTKKVRLSEIRILQILEAKGEMKQTLNDYLQEHNNQILLHMHLRPVSAHIGFISETWHCDPQQLNCHVFTEIVISKFDKSNHHVIMIGQFDVVLFNRPRYQLFRFTGFYDLEVHWAGPPYRWQLGIY